jgi:hypothetical protein
VGFAGYGAIMLKPNLEFNGVPVFINDAVCAGQSRMQPSAEFVRLQSPELVETTREWMLNFFGRTDDQMFKATSPLTGRPMIVTSTALYAKMRSLGA